MAVEQPTALGRYIYAIVDDRDGAACEQGGFPWGADCLGFGGGRVSLISQGRVAAVISDVPNRALRPERRHLATHYAVLKRLMKLGAFLPMAFGTIAENEEVIQRILQFHEEMLVEQLQRVEGKVEMGLKVSWNAPNIFEHFIHVNAELREARDKLFRPGYEPGAEEKINLGRLFERMLTRERAHHTRSVAAALRGWCSEIKENKLREEREVMNLVCLVAKTAQAEFEEAVLRTAGQFDDSYTFDISGPFPPHNFVDLDLSGADMQGAGVSCS
jgi:hypothetical protein